MLKIGAYVVVALIAIVLGWRDEPDTFEVQRSTSIQAPPEKVVGLSAIFIGGVLVAVGEAGSCNEQNIQWASERERIGVRVGGKRKVGKGG